MPLINRCGGSKEKKVLVKRGTGGSYVLMVNGAIISTTPQEVPLINDMLMVLMVGGSTGGDSIMFHRSSTSATYNATGGYEPYCAYFTPSSPFEANETITISQAWAP